MKLIKPDYYGFDHGRIDMEFDGGPVFCNEFCVNGEYSPVAVYKVKNPDRSRGHKKYLLLQLDTDIITGKRRLLIRGMSPQAMRKWRKQVGLHCIGCDTVIYSVHRHTDQSCECGAVSIDGGRDYNHINHRKPDVPYIWVEIDLITDEVLLADQSRRAE